MHRRTARCACALTIFASHPGNGTALPPTYPDQAIPQQGSQPVAGATETIDPVDAPRVDVARPRLAGRVVQRFDFEESRINPFPVPRHWRRAQGDRAAPDGAPRPGFPLWNEAALDYRSAAAGEGSVFLPAAGGSTSLRLEPGVVPVFPGANYSITAKARTRGLRHARARLVARLLNSANQPIAGSQFAGELIGDEPDWRPVSLEVPGDSPEAAFLQIDLELLQPVQFQAPTLGKHQAWPEDFAAAAWFDDVTVTQLPRIELSTTSPVNVLVAPARPEIKALVRDLSGEMMRARLTLYDLDGRAVDSEERDIGIGQASWTWTPRVEALGWYRVGLEVLSGQNRVAEESLDLVWLPEAAPRDAPGERDRFGVMLDPIPDGKAADTATLVRRTGAGSATIPIWTDGLTAESAAKAAESLGPLIEPLLTGDTRLTFSLPRLPRALAGELADADAAPGFDRDEPRGRARIDPDDPAAAFSRSERVWGRYLVPFLDRYGQSVRRWQIAVPRDGSVHPLARAARNLRRFERILAELVPGPVVAVPWPAQATLDRDVLAEPGAPDALDAIVEPAMTPDALGEFVEEWHTPAPPAELSLVLRTRPAHESSRQEAVNDLVRRIVIAWAAADSSGCSGLAASIPQPWSWSDEPTSRGRAIPTTELAAWRCLGDRLSGRRYVSAPSMAAGVRGLLFEPQTAGGVGLLAAWRDAPEPGSSVIDAFLGSGEIVAYDLFGNATPVESRAIPTTSGLRESRTHSVTITNTPVFIQGVDADLARFIASMRIEPRFVSSGSTRHDLEVVLVNPWSEPIDGRLMVLEPGRIAGDPAGRDRTWRVSPRQINFSIESGDEARLPVTLTFGAMEEAGVKPFIVDVDLDGRPEYGRLRLHGQFEIGLPDLGLDLTHRLAPTATGPDVVVEAVVTNNGVAPVTLELTAFAPPGNGFARSRATVSGLQPGESAVRRFPFSGGAARLRGGSILVGVQDTSSGARLNRSVVIAETTSGGASATAPER